MFIIMMISLQIAVHVEAVHIKVQLEPDGSLKHSTRGIHRAPWPWALRPSVRGET
jgi:hypothetical protein